jgi:hypothetical protein
VIRKTKKQMLQSIKKIIGVALLVAMCTSCNQGPTLQTYYVDNELKPGFSQIDAPTSLINIDNVEMTEEQRKAYKSIQKLNILMYTPSDSMDVKLKTEIDKVSAILKNPKYEELVRANTQDGKVVIKYLGEEENVDELIVFGSSPERGFVIARLLGDNMNAGEIYALASVMQNANFDDVNLQGLTDFFK